MSAWPNGTPVKPRISSPYGPRKIPTPGASSFHLGIDSFGYTWNCAVQAGRVIFAGYNGGAGYEVRYLGDNGIEERDLHAVAGSILVKVGDRVKQFQRLSLQGRTGTATGVHNHHGCRRNGAFFDPEPYLAALPSTGTAGGGTTPIESETPDMYRLVHIAGKAYMVGPSGLRTLIQADPTNYHLNLCIRVLASVAAADPMLAAELDIVAAYQAKVTPKSEATLSDATVSELAGEVAEQVKYPTGGTIVLS